MKTEISRNSHQLTKRYSGVYQQQGRMLTDADWNELVDILKDNVTESLKDIVGNRHGSVGGLPRHRSLSLSKSSQTDPLVIESGKVYVDGQGASLVADPAAFSPSAAPTSFDYDQQLDFPSPPDLIENCFIYIDVWERTVTHLFDSELRDLALHGADTCSRKQMVAQLKCCPLSIEPESSSVNPTKGNAPATITLLKKTTQPDPCDPCAELIEVDTHTGNYLYRLEVHSVEGDADNPDAITLKWSAENGAVQYALKDSLDNDVEPPADFTNEAWLYEFFSQQSEKHLGVHLADSASWTPTSGNLIAKNYVLPGSGPNQFVRRWDGYCRLTQTGGVWSVDVQYDKGQNEATDFITITGNDLTVALDTHQLELVLDQSFVAGDFWLAEVREAKHKPGDKLIEAQLPDGIQHYYLKIGRLSNGVLQANPQQDRKYAFPSLTELTRVFIAGGDGQEIMPGEALPERLKVGVANGEWPVEGAMVRFEVVEGAGSVNPINGGLTDNQGIAQCEWIPAADINTLQRVRATLVDPDDDTDPAKDYRPPLFFSANLITADQVAYEPACTDLSQNKVHSHLVNDAAVDLETGSDGYYSVKEVLDVILCELKAKHLPYDANNLARWNDVNIEEGASVPATVQEAIDSLLENLHSEDIAYTPACDSDTPPTIRSLLNIPTATSSRVHEIFNKILCELSAAQIPIDRSNLCPNLLSLSGPMQVDTVQDAINALCAKESDGGCCQIVVKAGDDLIEKVNAELGADKSVHICIESGEFILKQPLHLEGLDHLVVSGCSRGTFIRCDHHESAFITQSCLDVTFSSLRIITTNSSSDDSEGANHINGSITVREANRVEIESNYIQCGHGGSPDASCVTIYHSELTNNVIVRDNHFAPGNQQVGLLIINANHTNISNNQIIIRKKSNKMSLAGWLKNKVYRGTIRKHLVEKPVVIAANDVETVNGNINIVYEDKVVNFRTEKNLVKVWNAVQRSVTFKAGLTDMQLVSEIKKYADQVLLQLAGEQVENIQIDHAPFRPWFDVFKLALPAFGRQGIVLGGVKQQDVAIENNQIVGFAQGIHIGVSHNDDPEITYHAEHVSIKNNQITIYETAQKGIDWHGIYCGNFNTLQVKENQLLLEKYPDNLDTRVEGIQVHGMFGDMLQVRENRTQSFSPGIYLRALGNLPKPKLWQVENNLMVNSNGTELIPSGEYTTKDNIS